LEKKTASRNACTPEEAKNIAAATVAACITAVILTAQEQSLLQQNQYVRLHGLNKAEYNGAVPEGMTKKKWNWQVPGKPSECIARICHSCQRTLSPGVN
jgi:hypothetical protein